MRPAHIAPDAIIEAGRELQAAGRNITGFALRSKVGGGNPARLRQIWDEHASGQNQVEAEPVAELPVEVAEVVATVSKNLTERLSALAVELNDKAVKAAERRVHEVVRSAGEQRAQVERELADASQTVDDLETELDKALSGGAALEIKLNDVQTAHQAQAVELAQLRERLAVTERAAAQALEQHSEALKREAEQHAAEVARMSSALEAERARFLEELEHVRSALSEQRALAAAGALDLDQVRAKLAAAEADAVATHRAHQEQRAGFEREFSRVAEALARAEAAQAQAFMDASSAREASAGLRGQLEATQAQAAELLRVVSAANSADATAEKSPASPSKKTK